MLNVLILNILCEFNYTCLISLIKYNILCNFMVNVLSFLQNKEVNFTGKQSLHY